jgi:glycosyltransferase involved in cell wall biosynthesis
LESVESADLLRYGNIPIAGKVVIAIQPRTILRFEQAGKSCLEWRCARAAAACGQWLDCIRILEPEVGTGPVDDRVRKLGGNVVFVGSEKWDSASKTSKHHLVREFAALGARILYVENISMRRLGSEGRRDYAKILREVGRFFAGLRSPQPNVYLMNPLYLPFPGSPLARRFNAWFVAATARFHLRRLGMRHPVLIYFMPTGFALQGRLGERLAAYYITDNYAAFADVEKDAVRALEDQALATADAVFATAPSLVEARRGRRPDIHCSPHGVDAAHFGRAMHPDTIVPAEVDCLPRPRIGFMGGLGYDYVDLNLIRDLGRARRDWQIVLFGRDLSDISQLVAEPNIHFLGPQPYERLPSLLKGMDVAIIPFLDNELTRDVNPLKMREYLAAGLPVVATDLPLLRIYPGHVRCVRGLEGFISGIADALANPGDPRDHHRVVQDESWAARAAAVLDALAATQPRRR